MRNPSSPAPANRFHEVLLDSLVSGRAPFPLVDRLGARFVELGDGRAVLECDVDASHHNPVGVVHGGLAFFLMDTAMGFASMTVHAAGQKCSTVDVKINYIRAVTKGRLRAEATVVKAGRTVIHLEAKTVDERGRLVAQALGVAVLTPDAA